MSDGDNAPAEPKVAGGSKSDDPTDVLLARVLLLPREAQLRLHNRLAEHLVDDRAAPSALSRRIRRQQDVIAALQRTAEDLGLPAGHAPTTTQFAEAARRLDLGITVSSAGRAYGTWRNATRAFITGQTPEASRGIRQRNFLAGVSERDLAHHLAVVATWLDTEPDQETRAGYRRWRDAQIERHRDDADPLPISWVSLARLVPGLTDEDIIAAARGGVPDIRALQLRRTAEHAKNDDNPLDLITLTALAARLGISTTAARDACARHEPGFPAVVARVSANRVFYEADAATYASTGSAPRRPHLELQPSLADRHAITTMLGLPQRAVDYALTRRRWARCPPPTGKAGRYHYWLRTDVAQWATEHRPDINPGT